MNFFKRMGSASSSAGNSVRSVSIDKDGKTVESRSGRPTSSKATDSKELKRMNEQLVNVQVLLEQALKQNDNHKETINTLLSQVKSLEKENEQLVEQNQTLEERVEVQEEDTTNSSRGCSGESLKIKEREIVKLKTELKSCEDNIESMRQKYKTKLKTLRTNHGKSKQEYSLKMFELKDEIAILTQENKQLNDKLDGLGYTGTRSEDSEVDSYRGKLSSPTGGKSDIIIELSTHISEQEYKLSVLESQLEEKDLLIAKLQSAKLSPRDAHSLITVEAEKATQELQSLAKELKMLKRKKKRAKAEETAAALSSGNDYNRELSSLSRDSGAIDLSSPNRLALEDTSVRHKIRSADSYGLATQSHSNASFPSASTLVT